MNNSHTVSSAKSHDALSRELEYQKSRAEAIRVSATPEYIFARYRACKLWRYIQKEFMYRALGDVRDKTVLDFACGEGQISTQLAALGALVTGIDISSELISVARRRAELDGFSGRARFLAADLLQDPPAPDSFDFVFCSAALHHVDMAAVLPVLYDCLKPGGKIVIGEPVALSPLLQKFRDMLPVSKDASPDERQLGQADLDHIARVFANCRFTYFNLFARLVRFVPNGYKIDRGHPFAKAAVVFLGAMDRFVAAIPGASRLYGAVVIVGEKPAGAA